MKKDYAKYGAPKSNLKSISPVSEVCIFGCFQNHLKKNFLRLADFLNRYAKTPSTSPHFHQELTLKNGEKISVSDLWQFAHWDPT